MVPHVKLNLYKEDVASDGVTQTLTLVDHTETSSFDDWAQGFRTDGVPNMNCPGQGDHPTSSSSDWRTSRTISTGTTPSTVDLPRTRCRTTPSSSAMTACTTGTSCNRLRTTACTRSRASSRLDPATGKPTGRTDKRRNRIVR